MNLVQVLPLKHGTIICDTSKTPEFANYCMCSFQIFTMSFLIYLREFGNGSTPTSINQIFIDYFKLLTAIVKNREVHLFVFMQPTAHSTFIYLQTILKYQFLWRSPENLKAGAKLMPESKITVSLGQHVGLTEHIMDSQQFSQKAPKLNLKVRQTLK
ncbi:Hypothetical_protein [Hexamita inflata]|uniref:Hypothetical_protein n=1 Tax=Hexamita inflata TaxID=28002 RepID=A0AA86NIB5_9EUKA|nr:Hypothetical protein HINF_LOCUS7468 [Hexamita inflata]CAI9956801.1 Hypothetical protein HINF_LOCUS44446 [Hexamita inflata]